ncbi:hypothetical protein ACOQFB_01960 [Anaeromyxobacter sp. Red801]|uniref:hypothetical protein n=1 Tax=Anaeromyxobacter sp. Red801 TaxID=3411632 RepID=UPI003BA0F1C0
MIRTVSIRGLALAAALAAAAGLAACSSSDDKKCQDFCGEGAACVGGACVAVEACSPACDAGTVCQGAGASASCVPLLSSACAAGCAQDQVCIAAGGAAACVGVCGAGQAWNAGAQRCEATASLCGPGQAWNATALRCEITNIHAAWLTGPFTKGEEVTAECLTCHAGAGEEMLASAHFRWAGPTPGLRDAAGNPVDDGTIGKKGLINDFCVAVPSNEGRCGECHAGYGDPAQKKLAYQLAPDAGRVDCLVCHADLATGYVKAQKNFGIADVKPASGCTPACTAAQVCLPLAGGPTCVAPGSPEYAAKLSDVLLQAARSVRRPGRDNCGKCHFYAGGGDNVKMGDLASSLAVPVGPEVDVHMGSANAGAPTLCVDCHAGDGFRHDRMKGTGLSVAMVEEAPLACADCHAPTAPIHTAKHLAALACQTCHVPAFSRQLATKTNWNWAQAGYKDCRYPGAPQAIVDACVTNPASAAFGTSKAVIDGVEVDYNWQKGVFVMEKDVKPAYRWYDGTARHATISGALASFDPADGQAAAAPIALSEPAARLGDAGARITPFKHMQGRQPVMIDGSFAIVPHVFGQWSLWGVKPDPTTAGASIPVIPATSAEPTGPRYGDHATYAAFLDAMWNDVVSFGAATAGQLPALVTVAAGHATRDAAGDVTLDAPGHGLAPGTYNVMTPDAGFAPGIKAVTVVDANTLRWHEAALPPPAAPVVSTQPVRVFRALVRGVDWRWGYTEMFMNVNHEVAPRAQAISACMDCHAPGARVPVCELYQGAATRPVGCP